MSSFARNLAAAVQAPNALQSLEKYFNAGSGTKHSGRFFETYASARFDPIRITGDDR